MVNIRRLFPSRLSKPRRKLLALAEILLEEDFPRYRSLLELLETDLDSFRAQGYDDRYGITDEFTAADITQDLYGALTLLNGFADETGYSFWLDWTGESSEGSFEIWVAARVHAFGLGSLDLGFVDDWRDTLDWDSIDRGDFIVEKFRLLGRHIQPLGLDLIFLNTGEDAYHPYVVRHADYRRLPKITEADQAAFGFCGIQRWDELPKD